MKRIKNRDRVLRIKNIFYSSVYAEDMDSAVVDILADLKHYCKFEKVNFEDALKTAEMHFKEEQHE